MSKTSDPAETISNRNWLSLAKAAIQRWGELTLDELQRDLAKVDSIDPFEQTYLRAYWCQVVDDLLGTRSEKLPVPCSSVEELEKQSEFIERHFGASLDPKRPAPILKNDIAKRLDHLKAQLAREFESSVIDTIAAHEISSPIEQIFLMEWRFARVEENFRLQLRPQQQIRTDAGTFFLDYCITQTTTCCTSWPSGYGCACARCGCGNHSWRWSSERGGVSPPCLRNSLRFNSTGD